MTHPGWIVTVEHPEGMLFYAVALSEPYDAEDLVSANLGLDRRDVAAWKPAEAHTISAFKLAPGEMRGPF